MSAFDVILLVLVGGVLRTAIIGDDKGFAGPFIDELLSQNIPDAALDRALHAAGVESGGSVIAARLEPNGKITVVKQGGNN
jgi:uncharacterized membrane protein YcaP (DUF421 family)